MWQHSVCPEAHGYRQAAMKKAHKPHTSSPTQYERMSSGQTPLFVSGKNYLLTWVSAGGRKCKRFSTNQQVCMQIIDQLRRMTRQAIIHQSERYATNLCYKGNTLLNRIYTTCWMKVFNVIWNMATGIGYDSIIHHKHRVAQKLKKHFKFVNMTTAKVMIYYKRSWSQSLSKNQLIFSTNLENWNHSFSPPNDSLDIE